MVEIAYNRRSGVSVVNDRAMSEKLMVEYNAPFNLDKIPLFAGLNDRQRFWLHNRLYLRSFPEGVDVIVTGPPGEVVFIILSGTMKVYIPQPDGTDVIVSILGPGDPVGEMSVVDQAGRSANVITLEKSTVLWMNRNDFQEALLTMPPLSQNLLRVLSSRLRYSTAHIQSLAALDVNKRVVRQLLAFAERYGHKNDRNEILIPIRLTQGDMAELVGASRKRVNQAMVVLKRKGWIAIDGDYHIILVDAVALADWLNSDDED
jgi:CRP/FNR family transcriptional regulator, cyclic AMP receptor protein